MGTHLNPLVEKMRAKYPGAYDDMSDAELTSKVVAKYPQYGDLAQPVDRTKPAALEGEPTGPSDVEAMVGEGEQAQAQGLDTMSREHPEIPLAAGAAGLGAAAGPEAIGGAAKAIGRTGLTLGSMGATGWLAKKMGLPAWVGDVAGYSLAGKLGRGIRRPAPGGGVGGPIAPEPTPEPDVQVVPEPTSQPPIEAGSIPREELPGLAAQGKEGAAEQLRKIGKPIIYQPNYIGRK